MNPEIKAQWVADLRSGQFEQGRGYLNMEGKLCCLGVLCEQAVKAGVIEARPLEHDSAVIVYDGKSDTLPDSVVRWAGLPEGEGVTNPRNPNVEVDDTSVSLAELNDGENGWTRRTFGQIADLIEDQL
jgi:hypothetical protein